MPNNSGEGSHLSNYKTMPLWDGPEAKDRVIIGDLVLGWESNIGLFLQYTN